MRTRLDEGDDVLLDMTPMIDCVFLLLIFFLVATTLKKLDRELQVELPDAAMATEVKLEEHTLVIGLDELGQLYLDAEPMTIEQFHSTLQAASERDPATRVRIDADRRTPYEAIIHVVDQLKFWNLNNIGFHLRDKRETKRK